MLVVLTETGKQELQNTVKGLNDTYLKRSLDLGALEVSLFKRPYKNEFKCDLILSDLMKERNRQNEEHVFRNKYLDVCSCARVPPSLGVTGQHPGELRRRPHWQLALSPSLHPPKPLSASAVQKLGDMIWSKWCLIVNMLLEQFGVLSWAPKSSSTTVLYISGQKGIQREAEWQIRSDLFEQDICKVVQVRV